MPSVSSVYDALTAINKARLQEFGERLKIARQRRQWTQKALSAKTGVSEGTIKKIEAGNPRVPIGFWIQLLDTFALAEQLDLLAQPDADRIAAALEERPLRQRVRTRAAPVEFDLDGD